MILQEAEAKYMLFIFIKKCILFTYSVKILTASSKDCFQTCNKQNNFNIPDHTKKYNLNFILKEHPPSEENPPETCNFELKTQKEIQESECTISLDSII